MNRPLQNAVPGQRAIPTHSHGTKDNSFTITTPRPHANGGSYSEQRQQPVYSPTRHLRQCTCGMSSRCTARCQRPSASPSSFRRKGMCTGRAGRSPSFSPAYEEKIHTSSRTFPPHQPCAYAFPWSAATTDTGSTAKTRIVHDVQRSRYRVDAHT